MGSITYRFHVLLSVHENALGELTIIPAFAENYTEREFGNVRNDKKTKNQHYTIHNSPHFETENVINHTLEYVDGTCDNTRIYTQALKQNNLLSPLFLARSHDISNNRYHSEKTSSNTYEALGKFLPQSVTLYYMVVIGNLGFNFNEAIEDINIRTINFHKYSVSLLWSFGLIPSHPSGAKSHYLTLSQYETQSRRGFYIEEILQNYRQTRQELHFSFLKFLQREFKFSDDDLNLLLSLEFSSKGDISIDNTF